MTISATYMELIGKVNDDGSVKALTCMDMGDDFGECLRRFRAHSVMAGRY